jgi:hypothetical protein
MIKLTASAMADSVTPANQILIGLLASGQGKSVVTASASGCLKADAATKGLAICDAPTDIFAFTPAFTPEGGKIRIPL